MSEFYCKNTHLVGINKMLWAGFVGISKMLQFECTEKSSLPGWVGMIWGYNLKTISKNAYCNEIFVTLPRVLKNLICLLE